MTNFEHWRSIITPESLVNGVTCGMDCVICPVYDGACDGRAGYKDVWLSWCNQEYKEPAITITESALQAVLEPLLGMVSVENLFQAIKDAAEKGGAE